MCLEFSVAWERNGWMDEKYVCEYLCACEMAVGGK